MKRLLLLSFSVLVGIFVHAQSADTYFQPLKYRNIGPFRGGRSVTATGVISDPLTYYMGTTGGGLWKTSDAGQHWKNISDGFFKTGSVGAVAVAPSNPNTVFCGMGEHAIRGVMTSYGDGVYKSTDAGKTWEKVGLEKTQQISRIIIHPTNPDIVYVAAQGAIYGPTEDRGIYKTTDGGQTWKKVLYVNNLTGCSELSIDPNYPNVLYAGMWHHQRTPWKVISGGAGSGVYKSTDGGENWFPINEGLPEDKGKIAISVSPANSNKVYVLVEGDSQKDLGGLFVSETAGKSWKLVSGDNRLTQRAWYYTEVFTDPNDEHTIYVLSAPALRSIDGGKTWERITGTHGDYHDLWINPDNSNNMIIANDGGAAISFDQAASWSTQSIMPTAQFYRVNADNLFPYNLYGGQQDNSSVKIPNLALGSSGISEHDWTSSAGGESAFLAFDPDKPDLIMGGSYLGTIEVLDVQAVASTNIMAAPIQYLGREARDMEYLYNWNAPIIWSQHEPGTFYHGAQLVLRTKDLGKTWEEVSPDLTRNQDKYQGNGGGPLTNEAVGAENYGTLSYIIESPHEKGVLWTGSDDGLVHVTRNGGESWENITPKDLQECLVNSIEVSPHDPATAYIATTRYKFNDHAPAIYKTNNYGKSWTKICTGIPYGSFTRVVREDTKKRGLLYAGTETGIFLSWNDGKSWEPFQLNLPVTPITDLKVHQNDLLVATSGRSFWVLDDIELLAQYQTGAKTRIYSSPEAIYGNWSSPMSSQSSSFDGTQDFTGVNPANGLVVYYELPDLADSSEVRLKIYNQKKELVRSYSSTADSTYSAYEGGPPAAPVLSRKSGLNRFVWDLRYPIMPGVENVYLEASFRGHKVYPGEYTLEMEVGGNTYTAKGIIKPNPRYGEIDYATYDQFMSEMESNLTDMHQMVNQLKQAYNQIQELIPAIEANDVKKSAQDLSDKLKEWDGKMVQRKSKAYDDVENFKNKFTAEYLFLINQTESSIPRLNASNQLRRKELDTQWNTLKAEGMGLMGKEIQQLNSQLWEAGIGAIYR